GRATLYGYGASFGARSHCAGDSGYHWSGHRHRADPGVGVRAGRFYSRHRRPVVPAIRHYHSDLGTDIRLRGLVPDAGALHAAAAGTSPEQAIAGPELVLLPFQQLVRTGDAPLYQWSE